MSLTDKIDEKQISEIKKYSDAVCEQVRWKKAKAVITSEIESHIYDQRDAYIADGESQEEATRKAILQMGDPVSVGKEFDKTLRPKPQLSMLIVTSLLIITGMLINYFIYSSGKSMMGFSFFSYIIAFGVLAGCCLVDFTVFGKYPLQIYTVTVIMSFILILSGVAINGRLYLTIGRVFSFSLSLLSLVFPFIFSLFVYAMRGRGFKGIIFSGLAMIPMVIILFNVSSFIGMFLFVLASIIVLCYFTAKGWFGVDKKKGIAVILISLFLFSLLLYFNLSPFVFDRIVNVFDPNHARAEGYIFNVIKNFISESVFFGKGGNPYGMYEPTKVLPGISGDYNIIYAVHELGFIVLIGIAVIFSAFVFMLIYKILRQNNNILGGLTAVSIASTLMLQLFLSVIGVFGLGIGVSLSFPFITPGNSALMIDCALVGILISVFRTGYIYSR